MSKSLASVLACVAEQRINKHTRNKPNIIIAGSVTDSGANMRKAGKLLVGEEGQELCFNHRIHLIIIDELGDGHEVGRSVQASKDFLFIAHVVQMIRAHGDLIGELKEIERALFEFR